ncbi:uncharacterized protein B0I36DRAFT_310455 [Microdochium trichocladiopsis]|uniref:Uncharacterized protein n=1 Tax=Microdochium trichocladiopsis TaxID=1682393 RepID=A0A9P8YJ44_9PEZI|nr:uncharacterized protein B0I36DRAFT_310455 [Microdochium trichocladiopsis]KAH7040321.1 hypothetical protein B0I36DRAFT_310455 [Microdochium trichocladiopsis]
MVRGPIGRPASQKVLRSGHVEDRVGTSLAWSCGWLSCLSAYLGAQKPTSLPGYPRRVYVLLNP